MLPSPPWSASSHDDRSGKPVGGVRLMRQLIHIAPLLPLIALAGSPLFAQELPWSSLVYDRDVYRPFVNIDGTIQNRRLPTGAYGPAVVPDPADVNGESWYAFTPGHLWHTGDLGTTLRRVSLAGLDNLMFSAFAVAHDAPHILYVATGINQYQSAYREAPSREIARFEGNGVYVSRDRGETWERLPFFAGVPSGRDLRVLKSIATSAAGDTVLVTTTHRILRSVDAGLSWSVAHELPRLMLDPDLQEDHSISHARLYYHPRSLRHLFVTVGRYAPRSNGHDYVLVSHDGGDTWDFLQVAGQPAIASLEQRFSWLFAADPQDSNVFWVQMGRPRSRQIFRSGDGGQSWVEAPVVRKEGADYWAGTIAAKSLHVHPQNGDTLVLGYSTGHYQDGRLVTEGIQGTKPIHYLAPEPSLYDGFRYVEEDPGVRKGIPHAWRVVWTIDESLAARAIFTGDFPLLPYLGDVCTSPVPAGAEPVHRYVASRLTTYQGWRGQDGSTTTAPANPDPPSRTASDPALVPGQTLLPFPELEHSLANRSIHCHPHRYDILRGGQTSWGGTQDGGSQGERLPHHPDSSRRPFGAPFAGSTQSSGRPITRASFSRERPERVWVVTRGELFWSDDYSATFTKLNSRDHFATSKPGFRTIHTHAASADVVYTDWAVSKDGGQTWEARDIADSLRIGIWDRVVSHPSDTATVYSCGVSGVRKWGDYLQTLSELASASAYGPCRDLFVFPNNPDRMWMGTDTGLWETLDGGESWRRDNRGLPNVPITRINLSHDWEELLVTTFGRGLFTVPATAVDVMLVSTSPGAELPERSAPLTNYPNPFAGETTLEFAVRKPAQVRLDVFDVLGRRVETVVDQRYRIGVHQVRWNGQSLSRGVYLVRMEVDGQPMRAQKMIRR